MKIKNQHNKYILGHEEKIKHMVDNCYAAILIDGKKVELLSDEVIDDERVIVVNVEGL